MAALRLLRSLLCASLVLLGGGCTRAYLQNEGHYAFSSVEVLRDDCNLVSTSESLWDGSLTIAGKVVYLDYELMGMRLVGRFLDGSSSDDDAFLLDGSATNASIDAPGGGACLVNQVAIHLEGTTQCATGFAGVMRVRYEPQPERPDCACQLWVRYEAVQNSARCATAP